MRLVAIVLLVALLSPGLGLPAAWSEDEATPPTVAEVAPGEHWAGAEITSEDLVGKVVLFVLWGS